FLATDIMGTWTLLEAVRRHNIPRMIQISTDEVFGEIMEGEADEQAPFRPRSPYAAAKAGGDLLCAAFHETYKTPVIVTHACNIYGPYHYPEKLIPLAITNLLEGKPVPLYGDGSQIREWMHVSDHCRAIAEVLRRGKSGEVYNIGTGERISNLELLQRIAAILGKDESAIHRVADRPGHDRRYALSHQKVSSELGWKPSKTLAEGLPETVAWYREHESWWRPLKSGEYLEYYRKQYKVRDAA
ncbi:MAG: GDP-mannose 4,6-dehydratase, partial [Patescibacteria group bacterium]